MSVKHTGDIDFSGATSVSVPNIELGHASDTTNSGAWFLQMNTGAPFGNEDDTISKQLHINRNNLTKLGSVIYQTLERIDPGHGKKSLND